MSDELANEIVQQNAEADPKRPYKMYGTMIVAFLTSLLTSEAAMPIWVKAIIAAFIAALTVYLVPNPLRVKKNRTPPAAYEDEALF